jgi:hypothetical protein
MEPVVDVSPEVPQGASWIDELSDAQCMEIFWLYVDQPEEFLRSHPAPLLGAAMRHALRLVLAQGSNLATAGEAGDR